MKREDNIELRLLASSDTFLLMAKPLDENALGFESV